MKKIILCVVAFGLGSASAQVVAQTYKCKSQTGQISFSDSPCTDGSTTVKTMESFPVSPASSMQPATETQTSSNLQYLNIKVDEAIASGDLRLAKQLALTPEHWKKINEAEKGYAATTVGRTPADIQAEKSDSEQCKRATRIFELEAGSFKQNTYLIEAKRVAMYSACGMTEPPRTDIKIINKTQINR